MKKSTGRYDIHGNEISFGDFVRWYSTLNFKYVAQVVEVDGRVMKQDVLTDKFSRDGKYEHDETDLRLSDGYRLEFTELVAEKEMHLHTDYSYDEWCDLLNGESIA